MGDDGMLAPAPNLHNSLPVFASSAMKLPSADAANTRPPAVESTPGCSAFCVSSNFHCALPVSGSNAITPDDGGA
jgi:hypothetical protein